MELPKIIAAVGMALALSGAALADGFQTNDLATVEDAVVAEFGKEAHN